MILLGFFGGPEVILVIIAILILFGGRKIPELMKGLGKGIKEFKKATDENPVSGEIKDVKKEIDEVNDTIIESMDKENSKKTKWFWKQNKPHSVFKIGVHIKTSAGLISGFFYYIFFRGIDEGFNKR